MLLFLLYFLYVKHYLRVYAAHRMRPFKRLLRETVTPRGAVVKSMPKSMRDRSFSALSRPVHTSFPGICLEQHGKKAPSTSTDMSLTITFFAT